MNIGITAMSVLKCDAISVLTGTMITNVVVVLASWASSLCGKDLTNELFPPFKEVLGRRQG